MSGIPVQPRHDRRSVQSAERHHESTLVRSARRAVNANAAAEQHAHHLADVRSSVAALDELPDAAADASQQRTGCAARRPDYGILEYRPCREPAAGTQKSQL